MAIITQTIRRNEKLVLLAKPTFDGDPADLSLGPTWTCDNLNLLSLIPSNDGLRCEVRAKGIAGVANVTCTATGQTAFTQVIQITILNSLAETLTVEVVGPLEQ